MSVDSFSFPLDWLFYILIVGGISIFAVFIIISAVRRFLDDRRHAQTKGD